MSEQEDKKQPKCFASEVTHFHPFKTGVIRFGKCCECMTQFEPTLPKQIFCKPCRDEAWNKAMGVKPSEAIA